MDERLSSAGIGEVASTRVIEAQRTRTLAAMPEPIGTFVTSTEWLADGVPVVSVIGELDLATTPTLDDTLRALPDNQVVVDLTRCGFIALSGLRVLVAARERLERFDRPMGLVVDNPSLQRIFEITRVEALFEIYPSLAAAAECHDDG